MYRSCQLTIFYNVNLLLPEMLHCISGIVGLQLNTLLMCCHADTYDITPTTQITPRPDPPERTLGSRDQTHVEPPVRKRHMRTTRGFPLLDATPQECS